MVATAFQNGDISGEFATVSKLSRVLFLLPIMIMLSRLANTNANLANTNLASAKQQSLPVPWFVILFVLLVCINSTPLISEPFRAFTLQVNQLLLAVSLAAMGLETNLSKLWQIGTAPLYLAAASWLFLSILSLGLLKVFYK